MATDAAQVERILSQVESLPTLPSVAMRLLELTSDSTSSAREVVRLVESDQSIASRILSLVRRAHIGANVTSVERAVVLLGFDAVRCLVLSMQVFETFAQRQPGDGRFDVAGLWKHSLAVGCAARLLAHEMARSRGKDARKAASIEPALPKPEEAFLCGLLHDVGKVALHFCFPRSYDRVVTAVESNRSCIADQEREVFGVDHTIAGRRLAMHWKLPSMIAESIWLHHHTPESTPQRIGFRTTVEVVQLADRLARQMHVGYSGNHLVEPASAVAESMGVTQEILEQVISELPELMEERAELIGLDRMTSKEVFQGALVQANAELGRINARLSAQQRVLEHRSQCLEAMDLLSAGAEDPSHEELARAAAQGLSRLYPDQVCAAFTFSQSRGVAVLAVAHVSGEVVGETHELPARTSVLLRSSHAWSAATQLPPALLETIRAAMGKPATWLWVLADRELPAGALLLAGHAEVEPDPDCGIDRFANLATRWLGMAESSAQGRQLHEELAEINRRLVNAQSEAARMRSLAMVGEMAAGAAHELNNPLAVISGRAQLLNREGASDEVRKSAGIISEHATRASKMVSELMEFAKPAAPAPDVIELPALLARLRSNWVARNVITAEQFQLDISDTAIRVWADEAQITILFDELIRNAVEAMSGTPKPCLLVNCCTYPTDDRVVIRIEDNGRGMPPEVLERAAAPFFSSRPAGRGRGLGLSRAWRYAEINGGRIRLSSRKGHGTQAIIELPAAASHAKQASNSKT